MGGPVVEVEVDGVQPLKVALLGCGVVGTEVAVVTGVGASAGSSTVSMM